jgi:hypothetical protein
MPHEVTGVGRHPQAVLVAELEQAYESIRVIYGAINQWTAVLGAAWGALVTFGIRSRCGLMVLAGGVAVLILAYETFVAGKAIVALLVVTLAIERRLELPESHSVGAAFILGFRGPKSLEELKELPADPQAPANTGVVGFKPGDSLFHPRRSATALLIWCLAVVQILGSILLMVSGYFRLV